MDGKKTYTIELTPKEVGMVVDSKTKTKKNKKLDQV